MFFLYYFFSMLQIAAKIVWSTSSIVINLGDDVLSELQKIEAYVIKDGVILDVEISFKYDLVERTSLSTINTSIVKTYRHKIKAKATYGNDETEVEDILLVSITIEDNIKPVFRHIKEFSVPINSKMPNLLEDVIVFDNYDKVEDLVVKVDSSRVILSKTGKYPLFYTVTDKSGNINAETKYLYVEDYNPPDIKLNKALIHPVGKVFVWGDYFKITDEDPFIKVNVDYFNYNVLGEYHFYLEAIDPSGNKAIVETKITVIDDVVPILTIAKSPKAIAYGDDDYENKLRSYIVSVSDNYDSLSKDDVLINTDLNPYEIGTYEVIYIVRDSSNNEKNESIQIKVTDQDKPTIYVEDLYIFSVYSPKILIEDLIIVEDNYSKPGDIKVDITGPFNMDKIDDYIITIKATDEAGNSTTKKIIIRIVDNEPPEINKISSIIITEFEKPNYLDFYIVKDNYDKNPSLVIDDSLVNYNELGKYEIIITASDGVGNQSVLEDVVEVIDIYAPVITLRQNKIFLKADDINYDFKSLIMDAYDNYDNLTKADVIIINNIDFNKVGEQEIIYYLEDQSKNIKKEILSVFIYEEEDLDIEFKTAIINQNDDFDLMDGLNIDLNKYDVKSYPNYINTKEPGKYYVTYILTDKNGNTNKVDREIIVEPSVKTFEIINYLPMTALTIIGIVISVIFYVKKRKQIF